MSTTTTQPKSSPCADGTVGVPHGYKRTELGLIPARWRHGVLGDRISEMTDFVAAGSFESLRNNVRVYDSPNFALYVRLFDLRLGLGHGTQKYVDKASYEFLSKSNLYGNEILIANIGANVGEVFLMPTAMGPATIAPNMIVVRTDDKTLRYDYLYHYVKSDLGQSRINELIGGSGHPKISKTDLKRYKIVYPPLPEQRTIAGALSDVDGLIAALDKLIAKKRAIKQAAMQQLLTGKTRLPGFSREWETKRLAEVFAIRIGTSKSQYVVDGGAHFVVDMGSVSTAGHLIASKATDYHDDFLERGDLIMPKDDIGGGHIIGKVAYIDANKRYVLGDHVYALRSRQGDSLFFSYVINGPETNTALKSKVSGTAQLGLARKAVEEQEIPFPAIEEQNAIATVLSGMDAEIATLERRRHKTKQIKLGMMQQLLTGRVRLVNPPEAEAKA